VTVQILHRQRAGCAGRARLALAAFSLSVVAAGASLPSAAQAASHPDFSGFWVIKGDPLKVPAAPSTPAAAKTAKALLEAKGLDAPAGSPAYASNWCTAEGVPWQMTHDMIDIRQGPLAVSMSFRGEWDNRHIYIDGQKHPPLDDFDLTTVGHSIGRWRGDTLVADTIGLQDGVTYIPGGALRTEKSRLVERYKLLDKDTLQVTSTWHDPTTLKRPHTYAYVYKRQKGQVWMTELPCDPVRNMRAKGLPLPYDAPK
jgi:hypothetical protein